MVTTTETTVTPVMEGLTHGSLQVTPAYLRGGEVCLRGLCLEDQMLTYNHVSLNAPSEGGVALLLTLFYLLHLPAHSNVLLFSLGRVLSDELE